MKKIINLGMLLSFLVGFASMMAPTAALAKSAQDAGPSTYTVMVGAERVSRGIDVMAFFPETVHVHVGDTVLWQQNSFEIHTVSFLAGTPLPELIVPVPNGQPGQIMLNPQVAFPSAPADGMYDGSTFANSGVMSLEPGQPTQFSLTFTQPGTYEYVCIIHNMMMTGKVVVEDVSVAIPSPADVAKQARKLINSQLAHANKLIKEAKSLVPKSQKNPDGTTTHFVLIGFSKDQVDLMSFFPKKLKVRPGDTVEFMLSPSNDAPHTVTFLNGGEDIEFVTPAPDPDNPNGPPLLLINPEVLMPLNPGQPLTLNGVYSSGLLTPAGPTSYTLKIGDISGDVPYECLLHDLSGMVGLLKVVPK